jgi:hypothetical protein
MRFVTAHAGPGFSLELFIDRCVRYSVPLAILVAAASNNDVTTFCDRSFGHMKILEGKK